MNIPPEFVWARSSVRPFHHAWIPRVFPENANDRILQWLEEDIPWKYTEEDFYRQFEISLASLQLPADLGFLVGEDTLSRMTRWLQTEFNTPEIEPTEIVAHLLTKGHGMGVHNDYRPGGEALRLLLQFGRDVVGGETVMFRNSRPESICRIIRPVHGTALAFEISEISYHAVGRVQKGQRFTLVYSFQPR